MNKDLIKRWLHDFKNYPAEDWFEERTFVKEQYDFFEEFLQKINHGKHGDFRDDKDFFEGEYGFEKMCHNIHSLQGNKLALALAKGKKERHYSRNEYVKQLRYLFNSNEPVEKRLNKSLKDLKYLGESSVSELIAYSDPNNYTFLNQRSKQAVEVFDIRKDILNRIKGKKTFGAYYEAFNDVIRTEILEDYAQIIYNKSVSDVLQEDLYSETTLMLEIDQFTSWAFEIKKNEKVKIEDSGEEITIRDVKEGFIDEIEISDFYSIKSPLKFDDLKAKKFIFFLGENGTGKTNLLKAISLSLQKFSIDNKVNREPVAKIETILKENPNFQSKMEVYHGGLNSQSFDFKDEGNSLTLKNIYAYGTQRNTIAEGKNLEDEDFLTLFHKDKTVANINEWLIDLDHKQLEVSAERRDAYFSIKEFELILQDLLDIKNLKLETNSDKVNFKINEENYSFKQLSEGFQGVINLVTDLTARLIKNNPNIKSLGDLKKTKGIVLIDELDMFLHPKWEKQICGKLHNKFPNIQFFVTTHSPILIDGILKDEHIKDKGVIKIFKLDIQNHQTTIERTYTGDLIKDWNLNILLNSQMFDDDYLEGLSEEQIDGLKVENTEFEVEKAEKTKEVLDKMEKALRKRFKNMDL
jgi:AAA15 family ATPase/GTPase